MDGCVYVLACMHVQTSVFVHAYVCLPVYSCLCGTQSSRVELSALYVYHKRQVKPTHI